MQLSYAGLEVYDKRNEFSSLIYMTTCLFWKGNHYLLLFFFYLITKELTFGAIFYLIYGICYIHASILAIVKFKRDEILNPKNLRRIIFERKFQHDNWHNMKFKKTNTLPFKAHTHIETLDRSNIFS